MTVPTSILQDARGFARDHAIDQMPRGLVWDMADYIPNRRGAKLEARGPWSYFSPALAGQIVSGKHAAYRAGSKLLAVGGGTLYDVNLTTGALTSIATSFPNSLHNGVLLRDRVYFPGPAGAQTPKVVTWNGTAFTVANLAGTNTPKPLYLGAYKDRLLAGGDPANPANLYFSPLETDGGPPGNWDAKSWIGTTRAISAIFPMTAQILVFHDGSIEKIRGSIPPSTGVDTDMALDVFSEQIGCSDPGSIVPWQENVCFANPHGVYLTDGATIRSLTDQGGIGDLWRQLYSIKRSGTQVKATVFLEHLFVTVLTTYAAETKDELRPQTLVCDLNGRTWFRWRNVHASCYIDSEIGTEEVFWGVDSNPATAGDPRLAKLSPMFFGPFEYDPELPTVPSAPDAIDGNGQPVLTHLRTGWEKLGPEGVKRLRQVYVSHLTQAQDPTKADVLEVGVRISPFPHLEPMTFGKLPASERYKRNRIRIGRRGYGIQVDVNQVLPVYVMRLFDIAVDQWPQDRGKL